MMRAGKEELEILEMEVHIQKGRLTLRNRWSESVKWREKLPRNFFLPIRE